MAVIRRINLLKDVSMLQTLARQNEVRGSLLSLVEMESVALNLDLSFWQSNFRDALEIDSWIISKAINYVAERQLSHTSELLMQNGEVKLLIDVLYTVCG